MLNRSLRHLMATLLVLAMSAAMSLPAWAQEDDDEEDLESETSTEQLEIDLDPAIADVGEEVELEIEVADSSGDEAEGDDAPEDTTDDDSTDDDSTDDGTTDDSADDTTADDTAEDGTTDDTTDDDSTDDDSTDDGTTDDTADDDTSDDGTTDDTADDDTSDDATSDDDAADDDAADDDAAEDDAAEDDSAEEDGAEDTGVLAEVTVDWGDGTVEVVPAGASADAGDAEDDADDDEVELEHVYEAEGEYVVTVTATFVDGTVETAQLLVQVGGGQARLSGDSRHETAIEVSEEEFDDDEASAVLLARADAFADALAAAPLAFDEDAPILLTDTAEVPQIVIDEIDRVLAVGGTVYLLGGEAAISAAVADTLAALGFEVVRIAGEDRIDTALQITRFLLAAGVEVDEVVLAAAGSFPDALSGGAYAAREEAPILLTGGDALDPRVRELLIELGDVEVLIPGGTAVVSEAVVDELLALGLEVERIAGDDRFETSAAIAAELFVGVDTIIIATGANFPDALAGGAQAGRHGAPILLVGDELPQAVADYIAAHADTITTVYVLGGAGAVSEEVSDAIEALLGD